MFEISFCNLSTAVYINKKAKELGVLPPDATQWPNSANVADYVLILCPQTAAQNEDMFRGLKQLCSGGCANYFWGMSGRTATTKAAY
jgi:hypothetical protein